MGRRKQRDEDQSWHRAVRWAVCYLDRHCQRGDGDTMEGSAEATGGKQHRTIPSGTTSQCELERL